MNDQVSPAPPAAPDAHPPHRAFSPARIAAIASNTLLELVRQKVFYFLLIFALILIGSSAFMVNFSFQEQFQVLKDVSLGAMSIFTWLLAVLSTAMLLPKEIEDRTLYTILAKPVPRSEYLLGKYCGVLVLLAIATLLMGGAFAGALYIREQMALAASLRDAGSATPDQVAAITREIRSATFSPGLAAGIVVIYLKAALFGALTLMISAFATSWIFTVIVSVVIYFIGHIQATAREYWLSGTADGTLTRIFLGFIALVFPDLQAFNLIDDIVVGNAVAGALFAKTCFLGIVYIGVYFMAAYVLFAGREL